MTPEAELVLALCRTPLPDSERNRAEKLCRSGIDWDMVLNLTAAWEVEPVVCANLRSLDIPGLPSHIRTRAADRERESRAVALARTLVLVALAKELERAGIPVIVLKGPAVGVMAYGDPSMRTFHDMDFLVRAADTGRARDFLIGLGYQRDYESEAEETLIAGHHALEFSKGSSKVELHCALVERHLRFEIESDELWGSAVRIECAGGDISVLSPPHLLLFLCAHGTKHEWSRLRWICDVAQLLQNLDAGDAREVVALARLTRTRRILAVGLRLAHRILGADLSLFPAGDLVREEDSEVIVADVEQHLGLGAVKPSRVRWIDRAEPGAGSLLYWVAARESWVDRAASMARVIFIPTDKDRGVGPLRWIVRPARLGLRFVRRSVQG